MIGSTKFRIGLALCGALITLTGCAVSGTPVAGEPDVRGLETGTFATDRHTYTATAGNRGAIVEGARMSAAVVPALRIDPSLSHGRGGVIIPDIERALDFIANVSKPVLEKRKFVTGYVALGADRADPDGKSRPSADATALTTALLRFPTAAAATLAARELEDVDLAVSPDNRKLSSTKYPDAYLHWRPGVPTIGAFLAHDEFVISLFIQRPKADATDLTAWVDQNLAAELTQLAKFAPTPAEKISDLAVDPTGLLARAVVADRSAMHPDQYSFATYAPQHLVNKAADLTVRQNLVDATGVEAHAVVDGGAVTRVRDQSAANALMQGLIDSAGQYDPITAPADVPTATCLKLNDSGNKEDDYVYRCYVTYKRYLAMVSADGEPEVRQKITAQYALLANSL
ncbi:DUF7373 family lipoprotein [Nocardia alba]|uniref:Beta-lactamase family protein n=1 Tax=Nocardia alba TaxID=225051 RepID=A0A4R1FM85_9NOCA|nr:hypothetical protein [Nocardia alba]TCJ94399.1 hypothetical protein DFR71_4998 [Nocardia alba]